MQITTVGGVIVVTIPPVGAPLGSERDATDIIGEAFGAAEGENRLVALPVARLAPDFLRLRTGVAGAFIQKFVTYGFRVAFVGDIAAAVEGSTALRDFVIESNRGDTVWFVADEAELERRLAE